MAVYPCGDDPLPVHVRIALAHLEQHALREGLAERTPAPASAAPVAPTRSDGYGEPSAPRQTLWRPSPLHSQRVKRFQRIGRLLSYRALAVFFSLLCALAFATLGAYIVAQDLPFFPELATLAVFGFALVLLEVWALPSLYRWVYWRWLLVNWTGELEVSA